MKSGQISHYSGVTSRGHTHHFKVCGLLCCSDLFIWDNRSGLMGKGHRWLTGTVISSTDRPMVYPSVTQVAECSAVLSITVTSIQLKTSQPCAYVEAEESPVCSASALPGMAVVLSRLPFLI